MKAKFKKIYKWVVTSLIALLFVGSVPTKVEASENDTLVIGLTSEPYSVNPFNAPEVASVWAQKFFYDTLVDQVDVTEFTPRLGEVTQKEDTLIEIKVNPDANWTDGTPITAEDVAFTINTIANPDVPSSESRYVAMMEGTNANGKVEEAGETVSGVNVIDDKTLEITTKRPVDINYFNELFSSRVRIAPAHVFGEVEPAQIHEAEASKKPTVTSGAYKFVEKLEGQHTYLEANEDYYRGAPKIKKLYLKKIESTAVVTELQAGNIQMTAGPNTVISPEDLQTIEDSGNFLVRSHANTSTMYLLFNNKNERFTDKRVRQALTMAVDRQTILDNLYYGAGSVNATPYNPQSAYYNEDVQAYEYNPEKAKELLEEAGFDFGTPIKIMVPGNNYDNAAALVQQYFAAVGVTLEFDKVDLPTFVSHLHADDFDTGIVGIEVRYDPDLISFANSQSHTNYMRYSNEEMDKLLDEGVESTTFEERKPIYDKVQELFKEEAPAIPLVCHDYFTVQVPNLEGGAADFFPGTFANLHEWEFK